MAYNPANNVFNTSTLTFDGNDVAALEDIEWHIGGQKVDIGSAADAIMQYGQGLDDPEVTCTIKGVTTINRGDVGDLSVSWNADEAVGPCEPLASAMVNDIVVSGAKNGPITTKIQFVPAPTAE